MTRIKKMFFNSITSLVYQIIALICGFILPRMFLTSYGSAVNGLVLSITQFLGFISLCEFGVGAVVQSSLYKPLADNDQISISKIIISSERFFRKIAYFLVIYTIFLMICYPILVLDNFDYVFTILLIFIISISTFAQYYFGMTYRLLLTADQLGFIWYIIQIGTLVLNTCSCVVLMRFGCSVHIVKLVSSAIFLLQPLCLSVVVQKKYKIDRNVELSEEPIKQKWNGLAQHLAAVVLGNTDTVVLTVFSTLENVSIYAVYNLVINGLKQIILSLTNGVQAMFGNMIAKEEMEELNSCFEWIEWLMHTFITLVFSITSLLIVPFISVYTNGVSDVNYIVPIFAGLITMAQASYCLRLPYNMMILAAGHYKQTQNSAIIEMLLNIIISIAMVYHYGLVGVAIGTLVAMVYRTCYFAWYLSKNILFRKFVNYAKHVFVDIVSVIIITMTNKIFLTGVVLMQVDYVSWMILAMKVCIVSAFCVLGVNLLFYRSLLIKGINIVKRRTLN